MDTAYEILGYYGGCRSYLCTQMFAFMAIETFLSFVLMFVALICTWSFGCVKCCCGGCKGCCSPLPSFKQEDYEDSVPQYPGSSSAVPIIAQPGPQPMMTMAQPMNM